MEVESSYVYMLQIISIFSSTWTFINKFSISLDAKMPRFGCVVLRICINVTL